MVWYMEVVRASGQSQCRQIHVYKTVGHVVYASDDVVDEVKLGIIVA